MNFNFIYYVKNIAGFRNKNMRFHDIKFSKRHRMHVKKDTC